MWRGRRRHETALDRRARSPRRPAARCTATFDVAGATFDSREVGPGDLFIALKGEATDGHRVRRPGLRRGRRGGAGLRSRSPHPHVRVADTMTALNDLAWASRARCQAADRRRHRLGRQDRDQGGAVRRARPVGAGPRAPLGQELQQPYRRAALAWSRMPRAAKFGVFEMGMNHAGELAALTRLVRPHVAIVTTIAPAHREYLRQRRGDRRRQRARFSRASSPSGTAIIPYDSPHRDRLIAAARPHAARILTFGLGEGADVRAAYVVRGPAGGSMVTAQLAGRAALLHDRPAGRALGGELARRAGGGRGGRAAISRWPASRSPSLAG